MVSIRFSGSKSWIWNLPTCIGPCASNDDLSVNFPVQRHRDGKSLEGRAHLEHAGGQTIDACRIQRLVRIVGVVIRLRNHGDDFAGTHIQDQARGSKRLELGVRGDEFVTQRMLHAKIDGKIYRILQPVGASPAI